jgi:hypothetical protein
VVTEPAQETIQDFARRQKRPSVKTILSPTGVAETVRNRLLSQPPFVIPANRHDLGDHNKA